MRGASRNVKGRHGAFVNPSERRTRSARTAELAVGCFLLCALALGLGGRQLDVPGLYYDEVIQAEPAVQFLADAGQPVEVPGMRTVRAFGGWFPLMTQSYMGALKSQALIPVFAVFGATPSSLRAATFFFGLCGLLAAVAWGTALLGSRPALLAGTLLAVDPSFLFASRLDWGSFAIGLLCRCLGLFWFTRAVQLADDADATNSAVTWRMAAAGLLLGAGLYNKIDVAVVFAALVVAAGIAFRGDALRCATSLATRNTLAVVALGVAAALGAAPLLAALGDATDATGALVSGGGMSSADWHEKLRTAVATLDGSYMHRLMLAGGDFESMYGDPRPGTGGFFTAFLLGLAYLIATAVHDARRDRANRINVLLVAASLLGALFIFFTPRAVRIHHVLNLAPLPHLVVAAAVFDAWRRFGTRALRVGVAAATAAVLASSIAASRATFDELRETGGRGRWSNALADFGRELESEPGCEVLSLDWGFHGPLRFTSRDLTLKEPFWSWWRPARRNARWTHDGDEHHVYLVHEGRLAVFDYGAEFLAAARALDPGSVTIRRHEDGGGDPAFTSIRIGAPHRVDHTPRQPGQTRFDIRLRR